MRMLIRRGRVIDPGETLDGIMDIIIEKGKIIEISKFRNPKSEIHIIDASGKIVTPGLIDMHVHFREPGDEHKETIETGCRAAVHGGFTGVCPMPNTQPVNDDREMTAYILRKAVEADTARVYPIAAITGNIEGKRLCGYGELKQAGAVALSDDGHPVMNSQLMRKAMEYANISGLPIISHAEDTDLAGDGAMNEGEVAERLGLPGIPNAAESVMVMRDIALCELTGCPLHIAHVSTAESVWAIREAKKRGAAVPAETAPHYFTLTHEAVAECGTHAKMNPPLRSPHDKEAILEGLADGTIDVIATDHAPHAVAEKELPFEQAANGIIGLETSISLGLKLVEKGILTLTELIEKMTTHPARILGLENGIKVGRPADITIIDPDREHVVNAAGFQSLSRNTPFDGWHMKGKAVLTMVQGKIIFDELTPHV